MVDKEAITHSSFESSVEIIKADSHTNMGDLEKAEPKAAPLESPDATITAQDWTGENDPENPQNW